MSVAALVLEHGGDEDQAIAGLLHGAIEDVGAEQEAIISARLGPRVAAIVRACTDADTLPKPPWQARKDAYIAHLEHVGADVLLVSAVRLLLVSLLAPDDLQTTYCLEGAPSTWLPASLRDAARPGRRAG